MTQQDWIGNDQPGRAFKDIRNTRPSAAEEKAALVYRLGELINKIPPHLKTGGSVNKVREWQAARKEAAKVAGNPRSSAQQLQSAINSMQFHWPVAQQ